MSDTDHMTAPDDQQVTARLAGAGSMRAELAAVLGAASTRPTTQEFRRLILDDNAAQKRSGAARMWAWKRLKLRYALDQTSSAEFQSFLTAYRTATSNADAGLVVGLMLARTDRLFREVTLHRLSPLLAGEPERLDPADLAADVEAAESGNGLQWSTESKRSVANHLVSSWRDVGFIQPGRGIQSSRVSPGPAATVLAAAFGKAEGLTDRAVLRCRWFRLLGVSEATSSEFLRAAAAAGLVVLRMQADVVEIQFTNPAWGIS